MGIEHVGIVRGFELWQNCGLICVHYIADKILDYKKLNYIECLIKNKKYVLGILWYRVKKHF